MTRREPQSCFLKFDLYWGEGEAWAGHERVPASPAAPLSLERSLTTENRGEDVPTGSERHMLTQFESAGTGGPGTVYTIFLSNFINTKTDLIEGAGDDWAGQFKL